MRVCTAQEHIAGHGSAASRDRYARSPIVRNSVGSTGATRPCDRMIFREVGFQYRFAEQEFFDSTTAHPCVRSENWRPAMRLYRTFRGRIVHLGKPDSPR
jgi:hypothetical protein